MSLSRKTPLRSSTPLKRTPLKRNKPLGAKEPVPAKPRATKPKKKALPKKSTLVNANDRLARKICHATGRCEACDWVMRRSTGGTIPCMGERELQWCHIDSRTYHATRWDQKNAVCMCAAHHAYFTKKPLEFAAFVEKIRPGTIQYLIDKSLEPFKSTVEYLLSERERLRAIADSLGLQL